MTSRKPLRMVHLPVGQWQSRDVMQSIIPGRYIRGYISIHWGRTGDDEFCPLPLRFSPQEYGLTAGRIRRYKIAASSYSCACLLTRLEPVPAFPARARVAELADARDLGSRGQPWGFKSPLSHHILVRQWAFNRAGNAEGNRATNENGSHRAWAHETGPQDRGAGRGGRAAFRAGL